MLSVKISSLNLNNKSMKEVYNRSYLLPDNKQLEVCQSENGMIGGQIKDDSQVESAVSCKTMAELWAWLSEYGYKQIYSLEGKELMKAV